MTRDRPISAATGQNDGNAPCIEHRITCQQGSLFAREYPGTGPAFVLMHGFPDNLHIYDDLIPYLTAAGRRVVAFDFLGFGASDKPADAIYGFEQQRGDLQAVVEALGLGSIVAVAHDASGPAAINFAIEHPSRVAAICMLNSAYADVSAAEWPELIEVFANPNLRALATAFLQNPAQFGWLLTWQQSRFQQALPSSQQAHFGSFIGALIADNFIRQPSSAPAFAQMTAQFYDEMARNVDRLPALAALDIPVTLIWGDHDPYLTVEMAKRRLSHLKQGSLHVLAAGHWVQADMPAQVAKEMLS